MPFRAAPDRSAERLSPAEAAWAALLAAARGAGRAGTENQPAAFALDRDGDLLAVAADDPNAVLAWRPGAGWETRLPPADPRGALFDLYLPICSGTLARPVMVGHLGQSLDGFIATHAGESRNVTGDENILHLHRMRALCDAVVVGAGTVAADDPQLTTRFVPGPNPLRVVLDPARRLEDRYRVFTDDSAETLVVCRESLVGVSESRVGVAEIVAVRDDERGVDPAGVVALLRARGCSRIFVEGGGVTVSMFLQAGLLDRLHIAIAPLLIGNGRPSIRLQPPTALGDCHRPTYRVFRMGGDVLFDCDLKSSDGDGRIDGPGIARII